MKKLELLESKIVTPKPPLVYVSRLNQITYSCFDVFLLLGCYRFTGE